MSHFTRTTLYAICFRRWYFGIFDQKEKEYRVCCEMEEDAAMASTGSAGLHHRVFWNLLVSSAYYSVVKDEVGTIRRPVLGKGGTGGFLPSQP